MRVEAVNRLRLRDVVVLRVDSSAPADDDILEQFAAALQSTVRTPIIILDHSMTLESLSVEQMAEHGWVRSKPTKPTLPLPSNSPPSPTSNNGVQE